MNIQQVLDLIEKIVQGKNYEKELSNCIKSKKNIVKYIIDKTELRPNFFKTFTHSYIWIGFALFSLITLIFSLKALLNNGEFNGSFFVFFFTLIFWLPGLIIHINYFLKTNIKKALLFSDKIEIWNKNDTKTIINRKDIISVIYVSNTSSRIFWSDYEYLLIETSNNKTFIISSLFVDVYDVIFKFFLENNDKFETKTSLLPLIKTNANYKQ